MQKTKRRWLVGLYRQTDVGIVAFGSGFFGGDGCAEMATTSCFSEPTDGVYALMLGCDARYTRDFTER